MHITIIQADGVVGVDGVFRAVDLTGLDPSIHAIQFDTVKGVGHIEYDAGATVEVDVRDQIAEGEAHDLAVNARRAAEQSVAAAETGEEKDTAGATLRAASYAVAALKPIYTKARTRRAPESLTDLTPHQVYLDRWTAAAPPLPPAPTAEQLKTSGLEERRSAALAALNEKMLDDATKDPDAPQAVKDYAAAKIAP